MSDFGQEAGAIPGNIGVVVSKFGGHPPEFYAERLVEKLIFISKDSPAPIRDQAIAYRQQMYNICLLYVKEAMKSAKAELVAFREFGD